MGSPISGLLTEAVLQRIERLLFAEITSNFWRWYADDTLVTIKEDQVTILHHFFNNKLPGITKITNTARNHVG